MSKLFFILTTLVAIAMSGCGTFQPEGSEVEEKAIRALQVDKRHKLPVLVAVDTELLTLPWAKGADTFGGSACHVAFHLYPEAYWQLNRALNSAYETVDLVTLNELRPGYPLVISLAVEDASWGSTGLFEDSAAVKLTVTGFKNGQRFTTQSHQIARSESASDGCESARVSAGMAMKKSIEWGVNKIVQELSSMTGGESGFSGVRRPTSSATVKSLIESSRMQARLGVR